MIDLTVPILSTLKESDKSILLIWAEGCEACNLSKPMYDSLQDTYVEFTFYKLQFSVDILPFYEQHIPKEYVKSILKNNNGDTLLDDNNLPIMKYDQDAEGNLLKSSPIMFPNFFIFQKSNITEANPYGFLGNIGGLNKEQLVYVLDQLSTQTKVSNNG